MPLDILESMKALGETGLWAQLNKIRHFAYMLYCFVPFMLWNRPAVAGPRVYDFIKALKNYEAKGLPLGTAGFCWGGHFVTQLCHNKIKAEDGSRLTDCGFVAHPSFLTFPTDIEGIELPYSCAAAQVEDPQMSPKAAEQTKEILAAKTAKMKDRGIEHEFVMYEGKCSPQTTTPSSVDKRPKQVHGMDSRSERMKMIRRRQLVARRLRSKRCGGLQNGLRNLRQISEWLHLILPCGGVAQPRM